MTTTSTCFEALALAIARVEIIINIIDGIALDRHAIAMAVVLVPGLVGSAFNRSTLALAIVAVPVEVVRTVLRAADASTEALVPDFIDTACLGHALAGAIVVVQVLTCVACPVSVAFASAGGIVPVVFWIAAASWLTALAGTHFSVEVVIRGACMWFAQAFAGVGVEVEAAGAVLVGAYTLTVDKLLASRAGCGRADASA